MKGRAAGSAAGPGEGVVPREKVRVAYVGHAAALSGGELALLTLLPALEHVEAHVLLAEDGPLVARLRDAGIAVEVLALPERTARLRKDRVRGRSLPVVAVLDVGLYTLRLARRLRQLRPDLVHTNSMKAHLYGGLAARLARVPQVWHARDRVAPDYLPPAAVRAVRAAARLLPRALVANSEATLATLPDVRRGGVRPLVLPSPVPPLPARTRRREDGGRLVVGCVGRLSPWKGQDVLLRAVAVAFPPGFDVEVRIVGAALFGEADFELHLRRLAEEPPLLGRVVFTGFSDDVPAELSRMDVLVHCSTSPEPFGQVVVQGMAAGLPVVAANAGGPAEIVQDGETGLLTPPGDVDALAAALRRLADDPDLRRSLGEAARAAATAYEPGVVAPRLEEFYAAILAPAGRGLQRVTP